MNQVPDRIKNRTFQGEFVYHSGNSYYNNRLRIEPRGEFIKSKRAYDLERFS